MSTSTSFHANKNIRGTTKRSSISGVKNQPPKSYARDSTTTQAPIPSPSIFGKISPLHQTRYELLQQQFLVACMSGDFEAFCNIIQMIESASIPEHIRKELEKKKTVCIEYSDAIIDPSNHQSTPKENSKLLQCFLNTRNAFGLTPLMISIINGQTHIAEKLIKYPEVDINVISYDSSEYSEMNALQLACSFGYSTICDYLLETAERVANINHQDTHGRTALMYACKAKSIHIVQQLLQDFRAIVNIRDKKGKTSLFYALTCYNGRIDQNIVVLLLRYGAHVNVRDNYGNLLMDCISEKKDKQWFETIVKKWEQKLKDFKKNTSRNKTSTKQG